MAVFCCGKGKDVPIRGIVTVIGCMLIFLCFGNEHTFGNMNPYMTSYLRNRSQHSHDVNFGDTLWIATGKTAGASVFMSILCMLEQIIPSRICILLGIWTLSASTALTYFSLSEGIIATIFTDGVLPSIGRALAQPIAVRLAMRWFPERKGIVSGLTTACFGGSAFAFNQIITKFINPDNLSPDQNVGEDRFFTQPNLLNKVPYCFVLLGGLLAVISTIGVLMMKNPDSEVVNASNGKIRSRNGRKDAQETSHPDHDSTTNLENQVQVENLVPQSLSPKEALLTARFYITWFMYFFIGLALEIYRGLFKTFIDDDYFLSLVASIAAVSSAIGNLTWGFLADRFTYKPVLMIMITVFGTFLSTFITTEYGGKPMFFIWVIAMHFAYTGVYVLLPVIMIDMFGSKYYPVNYGLIHTAGLVFGMLSSLITSQIKAAVGWHGIFLTAAAMPIIGFFFAAVLYIKMWEKTT